MQKKLVLIGLMSMLSFSLLPSCKSAKKVAQPQTSEPIVADENFEHTFRKSEIPDKDLSVANNYVVDLNIDFTKIIKAQSDKAKITPQEAKDEAYFNAIVENNIHVLVDPIYQIKQSRGKYTAKVVGFAGYYINPRPSNVEKVKEEKEEQDKFAQVILDLEKLAKIPELGLEEVKTFVMNTNGTQCCDGKPIGTGDLGQLHLINTTLNKPSLVDQYLKLKNGIMPVKTNGKLIKNIDENKEIKKDESNNAEILKNPLKMFNKKSENVDKPKLEQNSDNTAAMFN